MTTYLLRHASAGSRDDSNPHDAYRTLDDTGVEQSLKLSGWLRHEPIERILTSPYRRCVESVEPLACALGLRIECVDELGEGTDPPAAWKLLEQVAESTTVLCSHGDVIPDLIRRAQSRGMLVPGKSGCAKGSVWALQHWDGSTFATGIYTPLPGS